MDFFAECSARFASRLLAVDDSGASLTYGEIMTDAAAWTARLGPEKRLVLLAIKNKLPHLRAYLSLAAAGHAVVLMSQDLFDGIHEEFTARYRPELVLAGDDDIDVISESAPRGGLAPELSVLLSTSGSTGSPKLIRFSGAGLAHNARAIAEYLDLTAEDRPMAHLPFHYSFGMSILHSHMAVGATLSLSDHSVMEKGFWQRMADEGVTSLSGVPFHFQLLRQLRLERRGPDSLATLTQAGGKLAADQVAHWAAISAEKGWKFVVMYGQTEAGPRISWLPPEHAVDKSGSIGIPIPGTRMALIDEEGRPIEAAETEGELVIESPSVMLGYAETRADLARGDEMGGRLVTGDLAYRDADGYYYITGRKSRFIKLQGNRVSLEAVEHRLKALDHEVACVGMDDKLYIVIEDETDAEAVRTAALNAFSFPAKAFQVAKVTAFPRSDSGKLRYRELLDAVSEGTNP